MSTATTTPTRTFQDRVTCPGTHLPPEIVSYEPAPNSEGRFIETTRCVTCGFERTMNTFAGCKPHAGWHIRPDAPTWLLLRYAALMGQYGHPRQVDGFYFVGIRGLDEPGGLYWARQNLNVLDPGLTDDVIRRMAKLQARYKRVKHYVTEVAPEWEFVQRIHYADNSIEVVERAKDGRTRQRQTLAPGGDACF